MAERNPQYGLAELNMEVTGIGPETRELLRPYLLPPEKMRMVPDISVDVTTVMRQKERQLEGEDFSEEYLEAMALYRAFCEQALRRDVMFFHASAVEYQGEAYLFSGPSGAGKSTHAAMWKKAFGEAAVIINDDKPLLRFFDREGGLPEVYAYGTPWNGKKQRGCNLKIRVRGIAFLEKGEEIRIRRLRWKEALDQAREQCFHPEGWENRQRYEMLLRKLVNAVPSYSLRCDISPRAAVLAYEAMRTGGPLAEDR